MVRPVLVAIMSTLLAVHAAAQPGDRRLDLRARVLDAVFPIDVVGPYALKLVLRFTDSASQLVVVIDTGRKSELIRYRLAGMSGEQFVKLIEKRSQENPNLTERDIVQALHVDVSRSPIEYKVLEPRLAELKKLRISPVLGERIAVDDFHEFEFWYDTWQESVHYSILDPWGSARDKYPQDALAEWMLKFRALVANRGGARAR